MRNHRVLAALACVIASVLLAAGGVAFARRDRPQPTAASSGAPAPVPLVRTGVPRHGDCGAFDGRQVEPVTCKDPAANVEVAARRALGDPAARCPLYDRTTVLATPGGVGSLYVCWVPIGGGPSRTAGIADLLEVTTSEPEYLVGVCGDLHDQHVHAPRACTDASADGIVVGSVVEAARCPSGTQLAVPAATGRVVCWGAR
jgi:hypothetical protein